MKKIYIWTVAVSLLILSGCSNENMLTDGGENTIPEEYIPGDSDVEIKLSSEVKGNVSTDISRGSVGTTEGDADIDSMGVFCLAKSKQNINSGAPDISWFYEEENWSGCIMNNVKSAKIGPNISWLDAQLYFYPISQFYSYDFFACHPYLKDDLIQKTADKVVAQYTLDGSMDVIWGKATSNEQYAYSAKYFRDVTRITPSLALKHLLTRFTFSVKPGMDKNGSYENAKRMNVKSIAIVDTYDKVDVTIASLNSRSTEGSLSLRNGLSTASFYLKEMNGSKLEVTPISNEYATKVGESLMVYPDNVYKLAIVLTHNDFPNREFKTECWLQLNNGVQNPVTDFKGGTSYNVTLTINGPESISLKAALQPWNQGSGLDVEL